MQTTKDSQVIAGASASQENTPAASAPSNPLTVTYFRPSEAVAVLRGNLSEQDPKAQALMQRLDDLPGFMRIGAAELEQYAANFPQRVNITGYSGQGVQGVQAENIKAALELIAREQGWDRRNTLIISGGTDVGIPDLAVTHLGASRGFPAVGITAFPGVEYSMSRGYQFICTDEKWMSWGAEAKTMGDVANITLVAGGGGQALVDALLAVQQKESVIFLSNAYNGMSKISYSINGKAADLLFKTDKAPDLSSPLQIKAAVTEHLIKGGIKPEDLNTLKITEMPVSGLVTEAKNGQRRACAQDLLYFALTANSELLPKEFRPASTEACNKLQQAVLKQIDAYYLLNNADYGANGVQILRLKDAFRSDLLGVIDQTLQHIVRHDIHDTSSGCYGPACLGARNQNELCEILKAGLTRAVAAHFQSN